MTFEMLFLIVVGVVLLFSLLLVLLSRYKKCPSDRIMVIYGKVGQNRDGTNRSAKCIHGGAAFIVPVVQSYAFLDLTPISIQINLEKALSKQNIRINVPSRFTVGTSTENGVMQNAAERLLGLDLQEVQELAKDIILGQLRLVIATMDIEEINTDRDKFLAAVSSNVETELKKIGLRLINVNVTDINDESGYIEALGKKAAAEAINNAKKSVAEKERDGDIGKAIAERDQRIQVAKANSSAIQGENTAQIEIAQSDSQKRERTAEAERKAVAAEKVQEAKALEEAYAAEKSAETSRAQREKATQEANIIVTANIAKQQVEISAEAEAEQTRRRARGEADAILAKKRAEAEGIKTVLQKQAEGLEAIVHSSGGNPKDALRLLLADKMPQLLQIQTDAIKNIKFDKITVWDNGSGGKDGKTGTADFLSGLLKSFPPMNDMFDMGGMSLPEYLGKAKAEASDVKAAKTAGSAEVAAKAAAEAAAKAAAEAAAVKAAETVAGATAGAVVKDALKSDDKSEGTTSKETKSLKGKKK